MLLIDVDGTLLDCNSSVLFSFYLYKKGIFSIKQIPFALFAFFLYKIRLLSLHRLHTLLFRSFFLGKSHSLFVEEGKRFAPTLLKSIRPYFHTLLRSSKEGALLSSAPSFIIEPLAELLNMKALSTSYLTDNEGKITGIKAIVDGKAKALFTQKSPPPTTAFSDSVDDLLFLEAATEAVVVAPHFALKPIAKRRGWKIIGK
jgi:phosphoserine phosphatase